MYKLTLVTNLFKWWQALTTQSNSEPCRLAEPYIRLGPDGPNLDPQSGQIDVQKAEIAAKHGTLEFYDQSPAYQVSVGDMDPARTSTYEEDLSYANFFSRPVRLISTEWAVGAALNQTFDIWKLWADNPRIGNRLSNFTNFSGNLKVKVVINGNGFYFGGALLSYRPHSELNETVADKMHFTDINVYGDLMKASQRQHIYIDPTISQGGEMVLPFTAASDMWDLPTRPLSMGQLWLVSLANLWHANGLTKPVSLQIYAWCDNIKLSSPTQLNVQALSPQAGEFPDEHAKGPISKPAAIIAGVAGALTKIPYIGRYAMASKVGAEGVGRVAQMFGYCKPRIVNDVNHVRINQVGDLAVTDALDASVSLAINAKRELTVDPVTAGSSSVDELSFAEFAKKESLIATIPWALTRATNDVLCGIPVNPGNFVLDTRTLPPLNEAISLTPVGLVSLPFQYWRGVLRFRFQMICSAYHKGRLLIVWDPTGAQANPETQVVRSKIVDIAEERDFTIDIGWGVPTPGLMNNRSYLANSVITSGLAVYRRGTDNGTIGVYVLNELTTSGSNTDPIAINVWMSSPGIEVYAPDADNFAQYTTLPISSVPVTATKIDLNPSDDVGLSPQSGDATSDSIPDDVNRPNAGPSIEMWGTPISNELSAVVHGDPIHNFRCMLKRFCLEEVLHFDLPDNGAFFRYCESIRTIHPPLRNNLVSPVVGTTTSVPLTLRALLHSSFMCFRGGMRYKLLPIIPAAGVAAPALQFRRFPFGSRDNFAQKYTKDTENVNRLFSFVDESFSGMTYTNGIMGNIAEVEIPYYSINRFAPVFIENTLNNNANNFAVSVASSQSIDHYYMMMSAAADDYNLFMFRGVPSLYLATNPPVVSP